MPDWKPHIRSRLASLRLSSSRENEIIEELSQHLEDRWRELVAGGAPEDEATKLALAGFRGGICSHDTSRRCDRRTHPNPSRRGLPTDTCLEISGRTSAMPPAR